MKKGDYIILAVMTAVLCISLFAVKRMPESSGNLKAVITVDGETKEIIKLTDNYKKKIEIKSDLGYNIIEINSGKIRVTDSDCPDKSDVNAGYIYKAGQTIICLPHKLIISLEGDGDLDYVSY